MISHVLDTCAVLDLASGRWTDAVARKELSHASDPVVLSLTAWELARKLRLGKIKLPCTVSETAEFVSEVAKRHQLRIIPLDADLCCAAEMLPPHHEDPFDRMILALAVRCFCPVFTTDRQFDSYPVTIIRPR